MNGYMFKDTNNNANILLGSNNVNNTKINNTKTVKVNNRKNNTNNKVKANNTKTNKVNNTKNVSANKVNNKVNTNKVNNSKSNTKNKNIDIVGAIVKLLDMQIKIKIYHWMTSKYSRHKAADNFLDTLYPIIDRIVETYQGKYGIISYNDSIIQLEDINDIDIIIYVKNMRNYFANDFCKLLNYKYDQDILSIKDELVEALNIFLYLLKLD